MYVYMHVYIDLYIPRSTRCMYDVCIGDVYVCIDACIH